jgi:G:T/U-mismatch repair DNA glycosylase
MRTTSVLCTVALVACLAATSAAAQQPVFHGEHEGGLSPAPEALSPRTRELGQSVQRLRERIQETNRWMIVRGSPEGLHGVGTEMAHAGEHLQELTRRLDEAYADPEISGDAARRRAVDALARQVGELEAQMGRTLALLRAAIGYH